ncbi:MAG: HEAT repeat domain-containing protein, partial [Candidatus Zixiibacteriota bacterium]
FLNISDWVKAMSRFRMQKQEIRRFLEAKEKTGLLKWAESDRSAVRTLTSLLFDSEPLISYRAAEAMGWVSALEFRKRPEKVRQLLRRLFWMMNDESGNVGWRAPETIGEVLANNPPLIEEYAAVLGSYLNEEPFEKGVRIAIIRAAGVNREAFRNLTGALVKSLDSEDPAIRGLSIMALKATGDAAAKNKIKSLSDDYDSFSLYDFKAGKFAVMKVSKAAESYLKEWPEREL